MAKGSRRVPRHLLRKGMIVKTPKKYYDSLDETWRPLSTIWPDAPDFLRVDRWDWEEGESELRDLHGPDHLDLNVLDYPKVFTVVTKGTAMKRRNPPTPKKKVRIKAKREGKLGGPGYLSKSDAARRKLLRACVKKWGYRSCLGSIVALEVWGKRSLTVAQKRKLLRDRTYLRKTFGAAARNQPATPPSKARAMGALKYLNDAAARMRS